MAEGPVQVNMYGIRYFIDGDLSDPLVKKLMVQARNELQQLKGRNINNINHVWLDKPNAYRVDSKFGIDSAFIDVPKKAERKYIKISHEIERPRKEINIEYIPAIEAYDFDKNQIGYVICESGTFEPKYTLLLTENVISPGLNGAGAAAVKAANPKITVDPFYWPSWKYFEDTRPFVEDELQDKEVYRESFGKEEIIYTDIACTFEELIITPDSVSGYEVETYEINWLWEDYRYHCAIYEGKDEGFDFWHTYAMGTVWLAFEGHNVANRPLQNFFMTTDEWDNVEWDVPILPADGPSYGLIPVESYEVKYNTSEVFTGNYLADSEVNDGITNWWMDLVWTKPGWGGYEDNESYWAAKNAWIDNKFSTTDWPTVFAAHLGDQWTKLESPTEDLHGNFSADTYHWNNIIDYQEIYQEDFYSCAKDLDNYSWLIQSYGQKAGTALQQRALADYGDYHSWPPYFDYAMPCDTLITSAWAQAEDLDTIDIKNYFYELYLEVKGSHGLERFTIREEQGQDDAYWSTHEVYQANVRHYKISDDLYFVGASADEYAWENRDLDNVKYCFFRSSVSGVNRFVITEFLLGDAPWGGYTVRHYEIPGILTPERKKVYGSGEFRLFRRTTMAEHEGVKEKFEDTIEI